MGSANNKRINRQVGISQVLIPRDNWQEIFESMDGIEVMPVGKLEDVIQYIFKDLTTQPGVGNFLEVDLLSASQVKL